MTNFDQEHIDVDPFDKEYSIDELLPHTLLNRISQGSSAIFPKQWAIITDKATVHYQFGDWSNIMIHHLTENIETHQSECEIILKDTGNGLILFSPIEYELEIKGYMVAWTPSGQDEQLMNLVRANTQLFKQLIGLKHQSMLTSSLHGVVVEESYEEIKEKAEQLARSEEKYRNLSASLEIEVQKKTQEIRTAHAHLMQREKMAAIGHLSAGMAHEINNPLGFLLSNLNTLKGYAEDLFTILAHYRHLLTLCRNTTDGVISRSLQAQFKTIEEIETVLEGDFLLDDIPTLIEESLTGAKRIKKIVKDLKAVARPGESQQERINIHESIDAVLTIVQNRIGPKIQVDRTFSPVPLISGYPQQISQIWLSLILNALDALEDEGNLKITVKANREHVVVSISDTGVGISEEELSKIFDPFFTTKDVGKGTGLGLHSAYHFISKHGGKIEVQSTSGSGSTFTVFLPLEKR